MTRDDSDTTTWSGSPPPPIAADEDETVVTPIPDENSDATQKLSANSPIEASPGRPIAPSSSLRPMLLERIEPSLGRGERLRLDAAHWKVSLGRAEESDIRLYTASASRTHALIAGSENGDWILTPSPGKSVLIDGDPLTEPIVLEEGMNLVMGQDHLRCVTEDLDRSSAAAVTLAEGSENLSGRKVVRLGLIGVVAGTVTLIVIAWILFGSVGQ